MLLAPVVLAESASRTPRAPPDRARRTRFSSRKLLVVWLAAGAVAWLLVPGLRGGPMLGHTLVYWLIAAPLIDLAWLARRELGAGAIALLGVASRGRRVRGARRLRGRVRRADAGRYRFAGVRARSAPAAAVIDGDDEKSSAR